MGTLLQTPGGEEQVAANHLEKPKAERVEWPCSVPRAATVGTQS